VGGRAPSLGDLDEPARVRGVVRTHHQYEIGRGGDVGQRVLAVGGGVADVLRRRSADLGEPRPERLFDRVGSFLKRVTRGESSRADG
jgi:hypothetical protein